MPGSIHGGTEFFTDNDLLEFLVAPSVAGLPGDFNGDGEVSAADYVMWRNNLASTFHLYGNGDESGASAGVVDQADYSFWKNHFGSPGEAAGALVSQLPEPGTLALLLPASCGLRWRFRDRFPAVT